MVEKSQLSIKILMLSMGYLSFLSLSLFSFLNDRDDMTLAGHRATIYDESGLFVYMGML